MLNCWAIKAPSTSEFQGYIQEQSTRYGHEEVKKGLIILGPVFYNILLILEILTDGSGKV